MYIYRFFSDNDTKIVTNPRSFEIPNNFVAKVHAMSNAKSRTIQEILTVNARKAIKNQDIFIFLKFYLFFW